MAAIKALDEILNKGQFSNEVLNLYADKVEKRDQNFLRQLVYGVVENKIYLDYILQKSSKNKLEKLDKDILNIVRIALYELKFLSTKKYAVINEAVNNAKKIKFSAKGFVNGVLRNIDRNMDELSEIKGKDNDKKLSIQYSCDLSIIKYLKQYYENYEEIVKSFNTVPSFNIRVNTFLTDKEQLINRLEKKEYIVEKSDVSKDCLIIKNPINMTEIEEFKEGLFTIQDQSSILVSEILNPKENSSVLDLCAAPGSKSTHLLQIMNNNGKVVANDIAKDKLDKIKDNFERLQLSNFELTNYDAQKTIKQFIDKFDYVLVDAPCSGLGVIKRKPEIKLNKSIDDIMSLNRIQNEIIEQSYKYLKVGGRLVYSTCTLGRKENIDIVNDFISRHNDVKIEKINDKEYLEILPDKNNDGFFICSMQKQ
ncbi:16S rRNA (cytosine(967)-C(5))-methyltransferase RsmB [Helcococcus kunzii]|uniref:16S rRNA (cytosine(967)-C(5))-methyltransferase n=1 Tax=Helcococcus kunzii ATCC 51366 TaxID=883114 RepID=H3NND7_9FIRM|nr:16S rRNA (cytosine(967)-C(5))-methyltransferase RsmB [Helcococcus kunzii]EHR33912.1 ribosomal RNA small subunit methyltransferase B [Helcococcus kunzii ATCC 51366]MCT1795521.1 16S rRNA (cytosine(967)-C(5))-methyltransferase RsmB [Helcococcus kunzii]MCT1989201.1 16S rRNA (cytosine(967)-C(5))-methyltransferase RsmB [Helcococcus kunzii]QUY64763.1 16S rRNA (cytosine(967)-C(5))-methyltransferase RsmB [Helcococcus kunzii]QZO77204.1 16S rRNA (cytosine(967)-C(5))-methyltransferase RsmB [Helcococcus